MNDKTINQPEAVINNADLPFDDMTNREKLMFIFLEDEIYSRLSQDEQARLHRLVGYSAKKRIELIREKLREKEAVELVASKLFPKM
jgi:ABC-type Na+ transport system ATPase subunit NatA